MIINYYMQFPFCLLFLTIMNINQPVDLAKKSRTKLDGARPWQEEVIALLLARDDVRSSIELAEERWVFLSMA